MTNPRVHLADLKNVPSTSGRTEGEVITAGGLLYRFTSGAWVAQTSSSGGGGGQGPAGENAYQLAVDNGFTGTLQQWLASLKGAMGATGAPGAPGAAGTPGAAGAAGAPGRGITSAAVNASGHLVITLTDSSTVDAGPLPSSAGSSTSGRSVSSVSVNASGHLVATYSDASTTDLGQVTGTAGAPGAAVTAANVMPSGHLVLTLSTGATVDAGYVSGAAGAPGRGVSSAAVNASGHLVLTYTDGTTTDAGALPSASGSTSGGGGYARATLTLTATAGAGATATGVSAFVPGYVLYDLTTTAPARLRLYLSAADRDGDTSRVAGSNPAVNAGVVLDYVTTDTTTQRLSPSVIGWTTSSQLYWSITNSGASASITATLTYLRTE